MIGLLVKYARDHGLESGAGFKAKDVRWAVTFSEDGRFLSVSKLGDAGSGLHFAKCPDLSQPEMIAGGETRSQFLVDSTETVAPFGENRNEPKAQRRHAYFVDLLRRASEVVPSLAAPAAALADQNVLDAIAKELEAKKAKPTDKATLCIGTKFPVDDSAWHVWWGEFRGSLAAVSKGPAKAAASGTMRSLVSGDLVVPARTHPTIGGRGPGNRLVSFDKDAFRSYGLEQSTNAAMSEEEAAAYRAALENLLNEHGHNLAGVEIVHWFKEKITPEEDAVFLLESGEQQERAAQTRAAELLEAIRTGRRPDLAGNRFYALALTRIQARIMIRDWMEGPLEDLVENVDQWFKDLSIVHRHGLGLAPPPKFMAVLGATVRELGDLASPFITQMWRVAVGGLAIPEQAMTQALGRTKIEFLANESPNHARMGLLKAYHVRKGDTHMLPYLNEDHPDAAYHCGRLMAVLGDLQYKALGDVGAGVIQRYYAAASITPALVLGRLVRLSQFHLGKLEGGLAHWYQMQYVAPVWSRIKDSLPSSLTPQKQSLFALGYYHQMAKMAADHAQKPENTTNTKESSHV